MAFCSSPWSSLVLTPARAPAGPDAPGASTKSTGGIGAPMVRTGTLPDEAWKPGAEAVIFHEPVRRPMMEYRPRSSVVAVNDEGEAFGFSAVTVAPFKGWLFWSLTVPPMRPVCASAGAAATTSVTTRAAAERNVFESSIACISCEKPNQYISPMKRTLLAVVATGFCLVASMSEVLIGQPANQNRVEWSRIDALIRDAIAAKQTPGAVVVVGQGDRILYEKAFGFRAIVPAEEPMTLDTVFDLASLTKVVATTTAVMTLLEDGRLRLNDPVATYISGFERYNKGAITVRHLLTHVSGLRPDVDLHPWTGYDAAIELAMDEVPTAEIGRASCRERV